MSHLPLVFWDASGLAKRYGPEPGSETTDAVFDAVPLRQMFGTVWGYAECYWILNRKRNERLITPTAFSLATTEMEQELLTPGGVSLLSIEDDRVLAGLSFIRQYSLNSNDAAILATFLRYKRNLPPGSPPCVLVAADGRLLRAAQAEGLAGLNPELVAETDVLAFLASLS